VFFFFQLEYDALVPLGRRAICPGKIIHTNEITCLLGDNWFVECSADKAIELVNHRITSINLRILLFYYGGGSRTPGFLSTDMSPARF